LPSRITVIFIGFPRLYEFFHGDRIEYVFSGGQLSDLVDDLVLRYGKEVRESLLAKGSEKIDPVISVKVNKKHLRREELSQQVIMDGDEITFLRLLAGG
jgi:sulfur carrier protein ThiS